MKARYRLNTDLKQIKTNMEVITKEQDSQEDKLKQIKKAPKFKHEGRLIVHKSNLVGIDVPKQQLVQWLVHGSSDREVISLVAMGGTGKSTLARQVYDDEEVKKHFTTHAWITVSQSLEEQELLIDMVQQLFRAIRRRPRKDLDSFKAQKLRQIILELLSRGRYLIVLDDIWHLNEWNDLQQMLPNDKNSSRVMLTTRNNDIAHSASVAASNKVYILKPLPQKESWELFCKNTFRGDEKCPPYLETICECILARCEGLPLAIIAVSGILSKKSRDIIEEWDIVLRSFGSEISSLNELKAVLLLSFNDLPYCLKSCFLYISIFPEDHLIERARLTRLWIAEGFIAAVEGKTLENVADDYFNELVNRNLIKPVETSTYGRVKKCRVHHLFWEFIIALSRDQNLTILGKEKNIQWSNKIRRLSLHNMHQNVQQYKSISRLRSLFMFGLKEKPRMNVMFQDGFRLLKVFDLQSTPLKKFPVELVDLSLLKYLSLRNTRVETIPCFIGKLKNLETLDLKHSFVSELPVEILNLQRLCNILIYRIRRKSYLHFHNKVGFKAPANIGSLTSLQKLCFMEADRDGGALMEELGSLTELRRLGVLKLKEEDGKALCSTIEKLVNLRALSITASNENEITDLQHLSSPPPLIQRLYLKGRMNKLPPWIRSLDGLVRLHLTWTHLKDDPLVCLQDLPNLIHLELLLAFNGKTLRFQSEGFKKLKLLTIDEFEELQCLRIEKGSMPCVQKLNIQRCRRLCRVPSGIEHLTTLQVLEFLDMPEQLMKTLRPDERNNDYHRVAFIQEVIFTFRDNNVWNVQSLKSLIVLDDIWHLNEWNDLQQMLPNNKNRSRVMLTTRKYDIAYSASVGDLKKVYILKPLPPKESWELFCNQTFPGNEECPPYLEDICKSIIRRCEGLPLAIVAVSGVLAMKSKDNIEEWHKVRRSLESEINGLDELNDLKKVLSLSFNDLPYFLKSCFLYISIFPEDHLIERARLIRLWIAEGFIAEKDGKTPEDVADDYFNELLNRNLIQPVKTTVDGRVKKCRVHDLLRDIIVTKSRDQNVAMVAKEPNLKWPDKIRRLSIHNTQQNVEQNRSVSRLRSLFMFGIKEKPCMNVLFLDTFRLLKALDLQGSPLKKFPVELRDLSLLKYLSLRNTEVKTIPSFIGNLKNLETLDLKHSFVSELPIEISNLQHLRHILIYRTEFETFLHFHTKSGFKTSANIGHLTSLQKLSFIEADKDGGAIMEELGRLTQLRRLGILKLKKEDGKALCSNIEKLVNLRALSITANDENETIDLQHLSSPPKLIQRLYLRGRMDALPPWILSLHGLVRLHLKWSHFKDDPLGFIQDLPNLVRLELLQACKGKTLCFQSGGFKKLKLLTIDEFDELQCLEVEKGAMPCVQKLNIQRCKQLLRVPSGIEHLTKLQVLEFLDMPKELMQTLHPDENGDEYQRVAFIPGVLFTFWEDGVWMVQSLASLRDKNSSPRPSVSNNSQSHSRLK